MFDVALLSIAILACICSTVFFIGAYRKTTKTFEMWDELDRLERERTGKLGPPPLWTSL